MSVELFVHPGPAKDPDMIRSFVDAVRAEVKAERERDAALATIGRVRDLLGDTSGPLWSVRGVREADLRAALEAQP